MDNGGTWQTLKGCFCKWCGHEIKIWVSDYSEGYEGDDPTFCSMMCEWEALAFVMRHR